MEIDTKLQDLQVRVLAAARVQISEVWEQTLATLRSEWEQKLKQAEENCLKAVQREAECRAETCDRLCNLIAEEATQRKGDMSHLSEQMFTFSGTSEKGIADRIRLPSDSSVFDEGRFRNVLNKMDEAEGRAERLQVTLCSLEAMCGDALRSKLKNLESELSGLVSMVGTLRDHHHQALKPMTFENVDNYADSTPIQGGYYTGCMVPPAAFTPGQPRQYSLSVSHPPPQRIQSGASCETPSVPAVKLMSPAKVVPPDRKSLPLVAPRSPAGAPNAVLTSAGRPSQYAVGQTQQSPSITRSHSARKIIATSSATSFSIAPGIAGPPAPIAPSSYGCPSAAVPPTAVGVACSPSSSGDWQALAPPVSRRSEPMVMRMQSAPSLSLAWLQSPKASSDLETSVSIQERLRLSASAVPGRPAKLVHSDSRSPRRSVSPPPPGPGLPMAAPCVVEGPVSISYTRLPM